MVNLADHRGDTKHAAAAGNVQCVVLLLEVAANPNSKNVRGLTQENAEDNHHSFRIIQTEIASTDSNGSGCGIQLPQP